MPLLCVGNFDRYTWSPAEINVSFVRKIVRRALTFILPATKYNQIRELSLPSRGGHTRVVHGQTASPLAEL